MPWRRWSGGDEEEVDLGGGAGLVQAEVAGEAAVLAAPGEGERARGIRGFDGGGVEAAVVSATRAASSAIWTRPTGWAGAGRSAPARRRSLRIQRA